MTARDALPRFYPEDDDDAFDMPTTPPPPGAQDPYAAATRVGPIAPSLLAELMSPDTARSDAAAEVVAASLRPVSPSGIQFKKKSEATVALNDADLIEIYEDEGSDLLEPTSCVPVKLQNGVGGTTPSPQLPLGSVATIPSSVPRGSGSTLRLQGNILTMLPPAAVAFPPSPSLASVPHQLAVSSTIGIAHIALIALMLALGFAPIAYFLFS